jgi:hypothetical protein
MIWFKLTQRTWNRLEPARLEIDCWRGDLDKALAASPGQAAFRFHL